MLSNSVVSCSFFVFLFYCMEFSTFYLGASWCVNEERRSKKTKLNKINRIKSENESSETIHFKHVPIPYNLFSPTSFQHIFAMVSGVLLESVIILIGILLVLIFFILLSNQPKPLQILWTTSIYLQFVRAFVAHCLHTSFSRCGSLLFSLVLIDLVFALVKLKLNRFKHYFDYFASFFTFFFHSFFLN